MTKSFLFAAIVLLGLCSFTTVATLTHQLELQLFYDVFQGWTTKFNKPYGIDEIAIRFMNWKSNYDYVLEHNAKNLGWKLEMNDFSDMSAEEFSALHLGLNLDAKKKNNNKQKNNSKNNSKKSNSTSSSDSALPKSVDWRAKGAVSPVKDQGKCGGCYAFAAAGALEGLYAIKNSKLVPLSVQQMMDCSGYYGNQGCDGGLMTNAFEYTEDFGIQPEEGYAYAAAVGYCRQDSTKAIFRNTGHIEVPSNNFTALKLAVAKQPVTVGVEASSMTVQLYKSGVLSSGCTANLDHAVLIVGYNVASNGQEYWIVKNSWGTAWGLNGYMHLAMGAQNDGAGLCGINMLPSYPTV